MIIASKGAAGVSGAGLATLAGGLSSHRPELLDGVGLIVGIDRFMSEARALTNFAGNSVATVLVGHWTGTYNRERLDQVLAGDAPFDETTMLDDDHSEGDRSDSVAGVDRESDEVEQRVGGRCRFPRPAGETCRCPPLQRPTTSGWVPPPCPGLSPSALRSGVRRRAPRDRARAPRGRRPPG